MKKAQKENLVIGLLIAVVVLLVADVCVSLYSKKHRWYRKHADESRVVSEKEHGGVTGVHGIAITGDGRSDLSLVGSATYFIEGRAYTLRNGKYYDESEEDGIDQVQVVRAVPLAGTEDIAVWLKQYTGGSGVFWYVGLVKHVGGVYAGGNVIFIGDRITPGEVSLRGDGLVVNYLDRAYGEAMVAVPSVPQQKIILREAFDR